jgi:hypothetical protein
VAALRGALLDRDPLARAYGFSAFLRALSDENVGEARSVLEQYRRQLSDHEVKLFMFTWARFDGRAALEAALDWREVSQRRPAIGAAMYSWAFHDSVAARGALLSVADSDLEDFVRGRLMAGWTRSDRRGPAAEIEALPNGPHRQFLSGVVADEIALQGPDALIEWAEETPDGAQNDFKRIVFTKAAVALTKLDPPRAAAWVAEHLGRDYAADAAAMVAWQWAEIDPEAALDWAASLPHGPQKIDAVRRAFAIWLHAAEHDAEAWLRDQPIQRSLDPAIRVMIQKTVIESPRSALWWAARIQDQGRRERSLVKIGRSWYRRDPEPAKQWLERSGLPPVAKREVVKPASAAPQSGRIDAGSDHRKAIAAE